MIVYVSYNYMSLKGRGALPPPLLRVSVSAGVFVKWPEH